MWEKQRRSVGIRPVRLQALAGVLGYYYGIAGTLAYAAYYLSFLTGGLIVGGIRFRHGCASVQEFLRARFGRVGTWGYNVVVAVRLLSEVVANLLVVGILFGVAGTTSYVSAVILLSLLTLGYSMLGGLSASLRTNVLQAAAFREPPASWSECLPKPE